MKRAMMLGVLAMAMLAAAATPSQADQIWDFSFTNAGPPIGGNTNGTVTGTIDLPLGVTGNTPDDGTAAATSVFITSYPAALGNIGTPPIDAATWPQASNSFTVTSGSLTTAFFSSVNNAGSPDAASLSFNISNGSLFDITAGDNNVYGPMTFTFEPQGSPTPEPASLTLLGTGLLAFGGFGLSRRRRASGPSAAC